MSAAAGGALAAGHSLELAQAAVLAVAERGADARAVAAALGGGSGGSVDPAPLLSGDTAAVAHSMQAGFEGALAGLCQLEGGIALPL